MPSLGLSLIFTPTGPSMKLLTKRQIDCLKWLMEGFSSKQIASKLKIQEDTVNEHIQETKRRLKVSNRVEAVVKALKLGILTL